MLLLLMMSVPLEVLPLAFTVLLLLLTISSGSPTAVMRVCSRYSVLSVATWPSLSGIEPVMGL
jgi:hypothetical protein